MPGGKFVVMPARSAVRDARRLVRGPRFGQRHPARGDDSGALGKAQARHQLQHLNMHALAGSGAAFLIAVLWFDLMFDVQVRKHTGDALPSEVLSSISAYYRRVTVEAWPMNRLIAVVMGLTLLAIIAEIVQSAGHWWIAWISL